MESVAILSFACNVLQLVEQAIEAVTICKELYKRGSLDENNQIEQFVDDLTALNKDLDVVFNKNPTAIPRRANKLRQIANDVSNTAAELKMVLNQLKLSKKQGNRAKGGAFVGMLKTLYRRGTIDKLRAKLDRQDAALQSCLLKDS
jgi:hypothetical protein